jgi:hypothetical protein
LHSIPALNVAGGAVRQTFDILVMEILRMKDSDSTVLAQVNELHDILTDWFSRKYADTPPRIIVVALCGIIIDLVRHSEDQAFNIAALRSCVECVENNKAADELARACGFESIAPDQN